MALEGLYALVCAGAVIAADPSPSPATAAAEDRDRTVAATLAVQTAMQQGREHLLRQDFRAAVLVLEGQLTVINGNRAYLNLLQDAYRGYVKELRLAKHDAEAQRYLDRLRILDPGAVLDRTLAASPTPAPAATPTAAAPPARPQPTIRAKGADDLDDPFRPSQASAPHTGKAQDLYGRADQAFASKDYRAACLLYEQAYQVDRGIADARRERWAYCKLNSVVERINQLSHHKAPSADLEGEVRLALSLAPRLEEQGRLLLAEIQKRRDQAAAVETPRAEANILVQHFERNAEGLYTAETANFRIYHNQSRTFAEQAARVAENTRAAMQRKWFGGGTGDWKPRCELYLHATGQDYSRVTGVSSTSPGHSSIRMESGRVIGRRIDLHCDDPNLLVAVLPHETTHVVLAGQFGDCQVPRWADEGMAVLTEPREKVDRHMRNLGKCRQERQLFSLRDLMQLNDYPDPRYVSAFYAQSVALVDFLSRARSPQVFSEFLRDGLRTGYEPALQRHYNYRSFEELEQHWSQQAFVAR